MFMAVLDTHLLFTLDPSLLECLGCPTEHGVLCWFTEEVCPRDMSLVPGRACTMV